LIRSNTLLGASLELQFLHDTPASSVAGESHALGVQCAQRDGRRNQPYFRFSRSLRASVYASAFQKPEQIWKGLIGTFMFTYSKASRLLRALL
jgi:hypothetical protein